LYLQKLQTSGTNLIKTGGALTLSSTNFSAALPSVAVADNGVVGVLFDEYDGTNFHVHLALSYDEGSCIATNQEVYSFATNGMVVGYGIANHNRLLGDFGRMLANGNTLYGAFAARGNVSAGGLTTTNFRYMANRLDERGLRERTMAIHQFDVRVPTTLLPRLAPALRLQNPLWR